MRRRDYWVGWLLVLFLWSCNEDSDIPKNIDPLEDAYTNSELWKWIPNERMKTRLGFATGYGVNFNNTSTKLLIFLEGGGACFNAETCFINPAIFEENEFQKRMLDEGGIGETGIYARTDQANPFRDWNFVYIPYTTGDVHSGNNPSAEVPGGLSNQEMVGYNNISEVLNEVAPFFKEKGVTEVFFSGSSAGGYGTLINYNQVAESFPEIDISMIADSSPILLDTALFTVCLNDRFESVYNIPFPADFGQYTSETFPFNSQRVYEYLSNKYPDAQFGLFSFYGDQTIRFFFGFGLENCADQINPIESERFKDGVLQVASHLDGLPNWVTYLEEGDGHTMLFSSLFGITSVENVDFTDWLDDLNEKTARSVKR